MQKQLIRQSSLVGLSLLILGAAGFLLKYGQLMHHNLTNRQVIQTMTMRRIPEKRSLERCDTGVALRIRIHSEHQKAHRTKSELNKYTYTKHHIWNDVFDNLKMVNGKIIYRV